MTLNLQIQVLKEKIADDINNANLPTGVVLMILSEFTGQVNSQNNIAIENERKTVEEGEEENG